MYDKRIVGGSALSLEYFLYRRTVQCISGKTVYSFCRHGDNAAVFYYPRRFSDISVLG